MKKMYLNVREEGGGTERGFTLFKRPFEQSLSPDNRWVKMAALVPWAEIAKVFFDSLLFEGRSRNQIVLGNKTGRSKLEV